MKSVIVLRISGPRISLAQFFSFEKGMLQWALQNGLDRVDYPDVVVDVKLQKESIYDIVWRTIELVPEYKDAMIVVGVPGPVHGGCVIFAPSIPGLVGDLRGYLIGAGFKPSRVVVFNNTDLCAQALVSSSRGVISRRRIVSALLVSLGRGIGSAWILHGQVHVGDGGMAGELGHIVTDDNGPECLCGRKGCLELTCGGNALKWFAGEQGIVVANATELVNNPAAFRIIENAQQKLALVLAEQVVPLDVGLIFLSGSLLPLYPVAVMSDLINAQVPAYMRKRIVIPYALSSIEGVLIGGAYVGFGLVGLPVHEFTSRDV